jgi:hypothetical protein
VRALLLILLDIAYTDKWLLLKSIYGITAITKCSSVFLPIKYLFDGWFLTMIALWCAAMVMLLTVEDYKLPLW